MSHLHDLLQVRYHIHCHLDLTTNALTAHESHMLVSFHR